MCDATREWLDSLKAGDEVAISTPHNTVITRVGRTTATQIHVDHRVFSRKTGELRGAGTWCCTSIVPVTDKMRVSAESKRLHFHLSSVKWHLLSLEQLREINQTVNKYLRED